MRRARQKTRKKLGQLLVERGWITGEQLLRAIQSQRAAGGRIGTCLLEMDFLTEDRLLDALSTQLAVPPVRIEDLRRIEREILGVVPPKVAGRWQAIPFAADDAEVRVATLNVGNLRCLDELTFCTARRVALHVVNEARIFEALEKHYGIECPRRYSQLLDRLNRSRYLWQDGVQPLGDAFGAEIDWSDPDRVLGQQPGNGREPPPPVARSMAAPPMTVSAPAAPTLAVTGEPLTLARVDELLATELDRREIGEILLRYLAQDFSRCALFAVVRNRLQGWMHRGAGFDPAIFRALDLDLDQPSTVAFLTRGAPYHRGPLEPQRADSELARCWGGSPHRECLLIPVRLRGKTVMILYGDRGDRGLGDLDVERFQRLAQMAAAAFELLLLRRNADRK